MGVAAAGDRWFITGRPITVGVKPITTGGKPITTGGKPNTAGGFSIRTLIKMRIERTINFLACSYLYISLELQESPVISFLEFYF